MSSSPTSMLEVLEARQLLSTVRLGRGPSAPTPSATMASSPTATATASVLPGARQVEALDRGIVAVNRGGGSVYLSWRLWGTDPSDVAFNVYRSTNGGAAVKRNAAPITATTDFTDTGVTTSQSNAYFVRAVIGGVEQAASEAFVLAANAPVRQYLSIPLQIPPGGVTPGGEAYTYSANDTSVGDVDGDGQYEFIVKWDPSNSKDNSQSGYTGNVYIDAYRMDGARLWRIDLGRNIRAGAHYTQFIVYDLDGDGRAEVAMKTADGTIDGQGQTIGDANADYRNSSGYILSGPEYLTVFSGLTGAAMATTNYVPARGTVSSWGDSYGNRVDRFLAGVAYIDGQRPSLIMSRGYYTRTVIVAWDWRDGQLSRRWTFDSNTPGNGAYAGQGNHNLSVGDVDGDGRDEIVFGSAMIDDTGQGLYSTGLGHGDAMHLSDMDPTRPGLEVFQVHESPSQYGANGGSFRDAATGTVIYGIDGHGGDVGRGVAFDVDPRHLGYEAWTSADGSMYNAQGQAISTRPSNYNFGVWWDADPLRELLNDEMIDKWNWTTATTSRLLTAYQTGASSNNGTKATPALSGDLMGDWREEVVWRNNDSSALQIYTTTIPATSRLYTLMHDTQYRTAIAWQNVAYNQPPHPSFYLGEGMSAPPTPNIYYATSDTPDNSSNVYPAELASFGGGSVIESTNSGYNGSAYINFPTTSGYLQFDNVNGGIGGTTSISFRYALGAAALRTGRLIVNGVAQDITFTPTGAWTNWALHTLDVPLNAGASNVIRLESTGQDLANIDELQATLPSDTTAPTLVSAASRKTHGSAGAFDVPLSLNAAAPSIEPRLRGPETLLFTFSEPIIAADGTLDASEFSIVNAAFASASASGNVLTLQLTNAADDARVTITLNGLTDAAGNPLSGTSSLIVRTCYGDVNQSGRVTVADQQAVKNGLLKPVTLTNFLLDVNLSGTISVADQQAVKNELFDESP